VDVKKIAVLTPIFPYPPDSGSRIRIFNLIKILGEKGFRIFLLGFGSDPSPKALAALKPWCEKVQVIQPVARRKDEPGRRRWADRIFAGPFEQRPGFSRALTAAVLDWMPNILQVEKTIGAAYIQIERFRASGIRVILEEGGVHHLTYERLAGVGPGIHRKVLNRWRAMRLKRFEADLIGKMDAVVSVSKVEKALLSRMNPAATVLLVPNGVEKILTEQDVLPAGEREAAGFFCGDLSYFPNADAVAVMIDQLAPLVGRAPTSVNIFVAGGNASKDLNRRAGSSGCVHLLGYVDDVGACFRKYALFINPMRLGGGTRLKMIEAMAHGMACVSTATGAEGIEITPGIHALIADDPKQMAQDIRSLLSNPRRMSEMGLAARQLIRENYLWDRCAGELIDFYARL